MTDAPGQEGRAGLWWLLLQAVTAGGAIDATLRVARPGAMDGLLVWIVQPVFSAACLLSMLAIWPLVLAAFHREVFIRQEPYRLVAEAQLRDAIVILQTESALSLVAADLVRNPSGLDAPVLYARDTAAIDALQSAFPTRSIWRYRHPRGEPSGELVRAAP